jgi:hypothetical protein
MTTATITKIGLIDVGSEVHTQVALQDDEGESIVLDFPVKQTIAALAELVTAYDLTNDSMFTLPGYDENVDKHIGTLRGVFHDCKTDISKPNQIGVGFKSGDSGEYEFGYGCNSIEAIASFLVKHGFESQLIAIGRVTMYDWLTEYEYGFKRKSQELLDLELESVLTPNKGEW